MALAHKARSRVAQTMPVRLTTGHAIAVKRFDRVRSTRLHCLSAHVALRAAGERFGNSAPKDVRAVVRVVDTLKEHFKTHGVTRGDIELYAEQIDRPFLRDQRTEFRDRRK
jgi:hypothetical protein